MHEIDRFAAAMMMFFFWSASAQAELIWSLLQLLAFGVEPSWIGVCDLADRW